MARILVGREGRLNGACYRPNPGRRKAAKRHPVAFRENNSSVTRALSPELVNVPPEARQAVLDR